MPDKGPEGRGQSGKSNTIGKPAGKEVIVQFPLVLV